MLKIVLNGTYFRLKLFFFISFWFYMKSHWTFFRVVVACWAELLSRAKSNGIYAKPEGFHALFVDLTYLNNTSKKFKFPFYFNITFFRFHVSLLFLCDDVWSLAAFSLFIFTHEQQMRRPLAFCCIIEICVLRKENLLWMNCNELSLLCILRFHVESHIRFKAGFSFAGYHSYHRRNFRALFCGWKVLLAKKNEWMNVFIVAFIWKLLDHFDVIHWRAIGHKRKLLIVFMGDFDRYSGIIGNCNLPFVFILSKPFKGFSKTFSCTKDHEAKKMYWYFIAL